MSVNMGTVDRSLRVVVGLAAIGIGIAVGAGSAGAIVLFVAAAVLLATSAVGFCPLYALVRLDTRGHRPLTH